MQTPDYIYGNEAGRLEKVWTEDAVDQLTAQIDALTAERDALRAECEALRAALKRITDVADRVDGWQSFPQDVLDAAYAAIYNERSKA